MTRVIVTDRERVATTALERIAARGIVSFSHVEPREGGGREMHRCPLCRAFQAYGGQCGNRDCLAAIASAALDELRRSS